MDKLAFGDYLMLLLGILAICAVWHAVGATREYRQVTIVGPSQCLVQYGDFTYRVEPGETILGPCHGDPRNCARVKTYPAGIIRFQPPEPRDAR